MSQKSYCDICHRETDAWHSARLILSGSIANQSRLDRLDLRYDICDDCMKTHDSLTIGDITIKRDWRSPTEAYKLEYQSHTGKETR